MGKIEEYIRQLADNPSAEMYSIPAQVISVDISERTVDVQPLNGKADLLDINIQASLEMTDGFFVQPKVESFVIITFINDNHAFVSSWSEVDRFQIKTDQGFELDIDADGVAIRKENGTDFKTEIDTLLDQIQQLTVPTAFGASGVPINSPAFAAIKTALQTLLK